MKILISSTFFKIILIGWLFLLDSVHAEILFSDVSKQAGLDGDVYKSAGGHGLGINWLDINNDGWDDLFLVGGQPGITPKLFLNNQDGTFTSAHHLLPLLAEVEMSGSRYADYDRDGDKDLFIYTDNINFRPIHANQPDGPINILLKNELIETGKLSFTEGAMAAGLADLAPIPFAEQPAYRSKTASWLDFDRNGCIDLFVGHLVINSAGDESNKDRFYRNNCDGTFSDATAKSGINIGTDPNSYRAALVSGGFHLNHDLWPDLYVANVSGLQKQPWLNDFLYINQGGSSTTIKFVESINDSNGVGDDAQAAMGIAVGDVDRDGYWDIYISDLLNTELDEAPLGNVLYLGRGDGTFSDNVALESGVQGLASWGVNLFDADQDGWEDLYVSTYFPNDDDLFYRNQGLNPAKDVSFASVDNAAGISSGNARGTAVSDFDHDGDMDLAIVNQNGGLQLYRNDSTDQGHWLVVILEASESNLDSIGTIIKVITNDGEQIRQITGGSSAHSQDSLNAHFGLGAVTERVDLQVRWPSGKVTQLNQIKTNQYLLIAEDDTVFVNGFEVNE